MIKNSKMLMRVTRKVQYFDFLWKCTKGSEICQNFVLKNANFAELNFVEISLHFGQARRPRGAGFRARRGRSSRALPSTGRAPRGGG